MSVKAGPTGAQELPEALPGTLVVHPHFHPRRTGVTSHVEAMLAALQALRETRCAGWSLDAALPRISLGQVLRRARRGGVVWHAHRNNELLTGILLRALAPRLKVVFTRHAARAPGAWTRFLARRADRVVALTSEMQRFFSEDTVVIPHGVDLRRFHPPADRGLAWQTLGMGGSWGVGVVGRIRPDKGQAEFAQAWSESRHPNWRAVLIGQAKPAFLSDVLRVGGEGLRRVKEQNEIAPWYRGLSVVVQPSHSEGFSLVLLEALASGCCVVAAALPHFPRWVEHGRTGLLYPPGDTRALVDHLRFLFAHPEEAQAIGARAAQRARAEMGVQPEAALLGRLYDSLTKIGNPG